MADIRLDFDALKSGWLYRIVRRAVLPSILGVRHVPEVETSRAYLRVQQIWRRRLEALHAAGWKPVVGRKDLQYLRNWHPFGLEHAHGFPDLHTGCRAKNCPWRFARNNVANPLARLAAYFPEANARGLVLVSFHHSFRQEPRRGLVDEVLWRLEFDRRFEVDQFQAEAAVVLHTFLVTHHAFGFYRRGFLFARPERVRAAEDEGLVRIYPPSIAGLHRAAPGVFRYPSSLLYGKPSWTVTRLERSENRTMLLHYGGLRDAAPCKEGKTSPLPTGPVA